MPRKVELDRAKSSELFNDALRHLQEMFESADHVRPLKGHPFWNGELQLIVINGEGVLCEFFSVDVAGELNFAR